MSVECQSPSVPSGFEERELDARTKGQARQLDEARGLADLDDLRTVLDEGLLALYEAMEAQDHAVDAYTAPRASDLQKMVATLSDCGHEMVAFRVRLEVRLGSDHPITVPYGRAAQAVHTIFEVVSGRVPESVDPHDVREVIEEAVATLLSAAGELIDAAVAHVGTKIPAT